MASTVATAWTATWVVMVAVVSTAELEQMETMGELGCVLGKSETLPEYGGTLSLARLSARCRACVTPFFLAILAAVLRWGYPVQDGMTSCEDVETCSRAAPNRGA